MDPKINFERQNWPKRMNYFLQHPDSVYQINRTSHCVILSPQSMLFNTGTLGLQSLLILRRATCAQDHLSPLSESIEMMKIFNTTDLTSPSTRITLCKNFFVSFRFIFLLQIFLLLNKLAPPFFDSFIEFKNSLLFSIKL